MAKSSKKRPSIKMTEGLPDVALEMPLDASKIKEIKKCLENGHLSVKLSRVDLSAGRIGEGWLYD